MEAKKSMVSRKFSSPFLKKIVNEKKKEKPIASRLIEFKPRFEQSRAGVNAYSFWPVSGE